MLRAAITIVFLCVGYALGGRGGAVVSLVAAAGVCIIGYLYSDRWVLRMYQTQELSQYQTPELYRIVADLARRADLPAPKVHLIPQKAANAIAAGRNPKHAVIAVTEGLLSMLDRKEMICVLAHELAHVKNNDTLIGSMVSATAGLFMLPVNIVCRGAFFVPAKATGAEGGEMWIIGRIIMSILAPFAALIIRMGVCPSREYRTDAMAADIAGDPEGVAGTLEKLHALSVKLPMYANIITAHLFVINPLPGSKLLRLLPTHPLLEERIKRLRKNRQQGIVP